ncbi:NADH-ubiquinone oxidoreductase chain 3 (mitochondrion) [Cafeteria roenbergensis]|uniref:NADH-ubiquinone oxidoreductase chain 3 n=1 Tax=Cafeteria roenbergensis TaxID=33653 RepID=A0A5A8CYC5_CAFRO|nr:NADH-ubiquinone oxidoreductase chain 3 [Cafeteria roenbergensis]KAA0145528.1 NADH-ubiquinone oxidoreductase chain 3 [Cafeteria roenbergensis]KAA0158046.1 NADH-ubiquinone oxidoreductase chain 3 [Cafeteria roenbergensis]
MYQKMFLFICLSFALSCVLFIVSLLLASHDPYYEKMTAYECGFEPFQDARNKVDIRFYIVAILFIIFDIEVVFLMPWLVNFVYLGTQTFWLMIFFLAILALGFAYEIVKGALDW